MFESRLALRLLVRKKRTIFSSGISNWRRQGHYFIPQERYMVNQCFVGPEGLHIQIEAEDDDGLRFKTFVFKRN